MQTSLYHLTVASELVSKGFYKIAFHRQQFFANSLARECQKEPQNRFLAEKAFLAKDKYKCEKSNLYTMVTTDKYRHAT